MAERRLLFFVTLRLEMESLVIRGSLLATAFHWDGCMHGDYFGNTVVDEMPQETENDAKGPGGQREEYLVKEFFTLV
jgi:hypothetical protein